MTEIVFLERTETGYTNITKLESAILSFPAGKRLAITISDKTRRSDRQNNLLHMYFGIIGKELGYSKDEMKDIIKFKFLKREMVIEQTGEVVNYIADTHKLTKEEFSELIEKMIEWCGTNFGITLPAPDEQTQLPI
jgi:hypothetical protein